MPRRRANDPDDAWADRHEGEAAIGSICELRSNDPVGRPFEPARGPLGFCVDPAAYRRKPRTRRSRAKRGDLK
jgi:hypothetical protein